MFTASARKPVLVSFGLLSQNDPLLLAINYPTYSPTYATVSGTIDGTNRVFTLPTAPNSLQLYVRGLFQNPAISYSLSGNTITFVNGAQPSVGSDIVAIVS